MKFDRTKYSRAARSSILTEYAFWFVMLLGLAYCGRQIFWGETSYLRDLSSTFFPQKQLLQNFLRAQRWPLWNPNLQGGRPYLADLNCAVLYPLDLIFLWLPWVRGLNLSIGFHLVFSAASAYWCARQLRLSPSAAAIMSISYSFGGVMLSTLNILTHLRALTWWPLLLAGWHLTLRERRRRWLIVTVAAAVLQILGGAPEVHVCSLAFLCGWTLLYPYPHGSRLHRIGAWSILVLLVAGFAAVQIIPTAELVSQSVRSEGLPYTAFVPWSLELKRLPELLIPGFFGQIDKIPVQTHYWGAGFVDGHWLPFLISAYCGLLTVTLMLTGVIAPRTNGDCSPTLKRFVGLFWLAALLLALGRNLPGFAYLYRYVPLFALFRYPSKFLMAGLLPMALLAGCGAETLFGEQATVGSDGDAPSRRAEHWVWLCWGLCGILAGGALAYTLSDSIAAAFERGYFLQSGNAVLRRGLRFAFAHVMVIWFGFTLCLTARRSTARPWPAWGLVGLLAVDLFVAGARLNPTTSPLLLTRTPPAVEAVRDVIGEGRLFRTDSNRALPVQLQIPAQNLLQAAADDGVWTHFWNFETLAEHFAVLYGIPMIFHNDYDLLSQAHLLKLKFLVDRLPWPQRLAFLSAANVTAILTPESLDVLGVTQVQTIRAGANQPLYIYQTAHAAPRVGFVSSWETVASDDAAIAIMLDAAFDPRRHVLLHSSETSTTLPWLTRKVPPESLFTLHLDTIRPPQNQNPQLGACTLAQIRTVSNRISAISYEVTTNCAGYLVFAEPYYAGWRVTIDGQPAEFQRANVAFTALAISAGTHRIERRYLPTSIMIGLSISLICGGGLSLIVATPKVFEGLF